MASRSAAQRIGVFGEAGFRVFAAVQGITANKVEEDYGVDFLCQIDSETSFRGVGSVGGVFIGAAVRTATGPDARITLTRADVEGLLRAELPMFVILVDARDPSSPECWFRLLDRDFTVELLQVLSTDQATTSFTPVHFQPPTEFRAALDRAATPGHVEAVRLAVAESQLADVLGEATVHVERGPDGQFTVVTAFDLFRYFDATNEAGQRAIYLATFGAEQLRQERIAALPLHRSVLDALERLPHPFVVAGFTSEDEVDVSVSGPEGQATCTFQRIDNGTHTGYAYAAGFAITVSKSQRHEDHWVHVLETLPDPDVDLPLADHPDLAEFLRCCVPEAEVTFGGGRWKPTVDDFGGFRAIGQFARNYEAATRLPGWATDVVFLRQVAHEEPVATLAFLAWCENLVRDRGPFGFEVGDQPRPERTEEADVMIPWVANVGDVGLVLTMSGPGVVSYEGDDPVRVQLQVTACEIDYVDRVDKASVVPELIVTPGHPTLAWGAAGAVETDTRSWDLGVTWHLSDQAT